MRKIVLLRGINVSGKNKIKMAALRLLLENLGFENVETYIQSGNIALDTEEEEAVIIENVKNGIKKQFGYIVEALVLSEKSIKQILSNNPFLAQDESNIGRLYVTFLQYDPKQNVIEANKYLPDEFIIEKDVVYIHCKNGYGRTKLNNTFFEKKLGVAATTRNWKTVKRLSVMLGTKN